MRGIVQGLGARLGFGRAPCGRQGHSEGLGLENSRNQCSTRPQRAGHDKKGGFLGIYKAWNQRRWAKVRWSWGRKRGRGCLLASGGGVARDERDDRGRLLERARYNCSEP